MLSALNTSAIMLQISLAIPISCSHLLRAGQQYEGFKYQDPLYISIFLCVCVSWVEDAMGMLGMGV